MLSCISCEMVVLSGIVTHVLDRWIVVHILCPKPVRYQYLSVSAR